MVSLCRAANLSLAFNQLPMLNRLLFLFFVLFFLGCSPSRKTTETPTAYSAEREFRAAWVATVANINWPSRPGLPVDSQQREAIALLDFLQKHHFNAVIFQVRPQADALYQSSLEPWSYYLTGTQGKAPSPYYDPLTFWTEEAHRRGLELHVWLNPYRAHHVSGGPVTDSSIVKRKPGLSMKLKEGYWWFDPSRKEVQDHSAAVVRDIVKRYDIDGVHFDDYFYPYPSYNGNEDFPDSASWAAYQQGGGKLSRSDWRRDAVNTFIQRVYREIKEEKRHVKFGLSPFGIWRPGHPESIAGFDQYDVLYADAKLWLNKGWIDYFAPQLYWPISRQAQSYPVLLGWWQSENTLQRHLWPGISIGDTSVRSTTEVINQIMVNRGMTPLSKGVIHWSIGQVVRNQHLSRALTEGVYRQPALIPASPWLDRQAPAPPEVTTAPFSDSLLTVRIEHPDPSDVARWVVYSYHGSLRNYTILPAGMRSGAVPLRRRAGNTTEKLSRVEVTAVDRNGNESTRRVVSIPAGS
jgi:uncharacterized lipoprotein YddW (UPF0748 family)